MNLKSGLLNFLLGKRLGCSSDFCYILRGVKLV